jgi:hypothetical protein
LKRRRHYAACIAAHRAERLGLRDAPVRRAPARALAWVLWSVWAGLVLLAAIRAAGGKAPLEEVPALVALGGFATVGALAAVRQPGNAVGWLLLTIAIVAGGGLVVESYVEAVARPGRPLDELLTWLDGWTFYAWMIAVAVILPLLFPDGRLLSRRWRVVTWAAAAALIGSVAAEALDPGPMDADTQAPIVNPFGIAGASDALEVIGTAASVLALACGVAAAASVILRPRRARGEQHLQVKWFAYVCTVMLAGFALAAVAAVAGQANTGSGTLVEAIGTVGWSTFLAGVIVGLPVATALAVFRHRLYGIDVVINRTLVYGALTATLAAAYLGSVLLLGLALRPVTRESDLAIAGSTLAVAALFGPARRRIQRAVDRRFYRRRYDGARMLETFGARLRQEVDLDSLDGELRAILDRTVEPAHASLWLRSS